MIAIKRLQNILWILIVAFGALSAYLISLRVATERNAVQALDRRIHHARADIRYLETEFEARSNMRQLEQWNNRDYRYVAPNAGQYLPDERSLASLDGVETNGDTYVAPPVMMAMADTNVQSPAAAAADTASPAPAQIRDDETIIRAASAPRPAPVSTRSAEATASGSVVSGFCTAVALSPAACNRAITSDQDDPSANSPCTRTTLRAFGAGCAATAVP